MHAPRCVPHVLTAASRRSAWLAGLVVCLLAILATAPANAAWQAPVDLSAAGQNPSDARVAVNARGDAVAVWARLNGATVQGAVRAPNGTWQAPIELSAPLELSAAGPNNISVAQVAVDARGNAVVVWERSDGTQQIVQSVVRPAGGTWQAPVDLSAAGQYASSPQVAVDAQGNTVAVWYRFARTGPPGTRAYSVVQSAVRPAGGTWQAPVDLSAGGLSVGDVRIAVDARGNATAAWSAATDTGSVVQSAVRPAGGIWQAPGDLSAGGSAVQLAVGALGDAVAVWTLNLGRRSVVVQGAVRPAGGSWQAPVTLSAAGSNPGNPQIAVDARGNAMAVWSLSNNSSSSVVQSAARPAGANWQAPVDLAADAAGAEVSIGAQGNAFAVWSGSNDTESIVRSATRPAGGSWQAPVDLSAAGQNASSPQVAVDAQGNAVAIWERHGMVQSATYAAPGPQVTGLRLSPSTLRASRSGPTVQAAAVQTATQVSYKLNMAASVRFTVQRSRGGRSVGGRCVKATTSNRKQTICTRRVRLRGGFTRSRPAGTDSFTFTGRLARRALKPGRYRLVATPTANGRTGTPTRADFRTVR